MKSDFTDECLLHPVQRNQVSLNRGRGSSSGQDIKVGNREPRVKYTSENTLMLAAGWFRQVVPLSGRQPSSTESSEASEGLLGRGP